MDEEAVVVSLFLVARVFLVGGIFFVYPRITRKGLVFGTYVGEEVAAGDAARELLRSWSRGCLLVMALSLVVGLSISVAGWPVTGNLTGTAVLLLSLPALYLLIHKRTRALVPPSAARQAATATALLTVDESRGDGFAKFCLGATVLVGLATTAYATIAYEGMPERIPTFVSALRDSGELSGKSFSTIMFAPMLGLLLSSGFALVSLLISHAKRSVRGGSGGRSEAAQNSFRLLMTQTFGGMALFICLLMAVFSVQSVRIALAQTETAGSIPLLVIAAAMILFALASLVRIMRGPGQGGALLEEGSIEAPLTGSIADNAHWILGVIYINKDDPSIIVESRFGIGYSMNYGNLNALLICGAYLVLLLGLIAFAIAEWVI